MLNQTPARALGHRGLTAAGQGISLPLQKALASQPHKINYIIQQCFRYLNVNKNEPFTGPFLPLRRGFWCRLGPTGGKDFSLFVPRRYPAARVLSVIPRIGTLLCRKHGSDYSLNWRVMGTIHALGYGTQPESSTTLFLRTL